MSKLSSLLKINDFIKCFDIKDVSIDENLKINASSVSLFCSDIIDDKERNKFLMIKKLPVCFNKIEQSFEVGGFRYLKSLEGFPNYVGGNFYCGACEIESLEHGPQYVGRQYEISETWIKNLEYCPTDVGNFLCFSNNYLTSFDGAEQMRIHGHFKCFLNRNLTNIDALPKIDGNFYFYCIGNTNIQSVNIKNNTQGRKFVVCPKIDNLLIEHYFISYSEIQHCKRKYKYLNYDEFRKYIDSLIKKNEKIKKERIDYGFG